MQIAVLVLILIAVVFGGAVVRSMLVSALGFIGLVVVIGYVGYLTGIDPMVGFLSLLGIALAGKLAHVIYTLNRN